MKWILHDWSDEECGRILTSCRRAMGGRGKRLLVAEMVVEPGNGTSPAKMMDMVMLAQTGGRERTDTEYRRLFAAADIKLQRVIPTASPFSILEGVSV
jgi:hypothetical protein